jgi:hypothetical protein
MVYQTELSGFSMISAEGGLKDYHTRNSTDTSLVSSTTHAQPEEEDLVIKGAKAEGGSG